MPSNTSNPSWPSYNPGELRHIIQILQEVKQVDSLGQPQQIWPTVLTCKGAIDDAMFEVKASGREFYTDGLIAARVTHIITIRWSKLTQIIPGMRAYFVDQRYSPPAIHTYQILYLENAEGKDVLLRLGCVEINAPA